MGRLLEAAATTRPHKGGVPSEVDKFLDALDGEDREEALAILLDRDKYGHAFVARIINDVYNVRLTGSIVLAWRKRNCGQAR